METKMVMETTNLRKLVVFVFTKTVTKNDLNSKTITQFQI